MRLSAAVVVALLVVPASPSLAAAAESAPTTDEPTEDVAAKDTWERDRIAATGVVGLGSPVGDFGVLAEVAAHRYLVFDAGVGLGVSDIDRVAARWRVMPRLRLPVSRHVALGVGLGVSGGRVRTRSDNTSDCDECAAHRVERIWDSGLFADLEPSIEVRTGAGVVVRTMFGWSRALVDPSICRAGQYASSTCDANEGRTRGFVAVAVGGAF